MQANKFFSRAVLAAFSFAGLSFAGSAVWASVLDPGGPAISTPGLASFVGLTAIADETNPFVGESFTSEVVYSGTLESEVFREPSGKLDFAYYVDTNSDEPDSILTVSLIDFAGYTTDVDYVSGTGSVAYDTAERTSVGGGFSITLDYSPVGNSIDPGDTSDWILVRTNATEYDDLGTTNFIDGGTGSVESYEPVPEPGSIALALFGGAAALLARPTRGKRLRLHRFSDNSSIDGMRLGRTPVCGPIRRGSILFAGLLAMLGGTKASQAAPFTTYNVVVTGTLTDDSHVQGTTFVNNLVAINVPDFAQSPAAGTGDTLTVTGAISGSSISLERGVYRYQQATAPPANLNGGSTEVHDPTISISGLSNQLSAASAYYASLTGATVAPSGAALTLTASGTGATVFDEPASDLMGSNENVTLTASAGQSIIIDVPDAAFAFGSSEHITLGGSTSAEQILWAFPNASTLTLNDSQWFGSILAPLATLTDNSQNINGGVYVENFTQTAEVHLSDPNLTVGQPQFSGPTSVPEPTAQIMAFVLVGLMLLRRLPHGEGHNRQF